MTTNVLIYDCEIINLIDTGKTPRLDGYSYCNGWRDYNNMGISVIGTFILKPNVTIYGFTHPFDADLVQKFFDSFDTIIGLNSKGFDDKLLSYNGIEVETTYDLLEEIRYAAYSSRSWEDCPKGYSYKLDLIAQANGMAKSGSGELAPKLWQDGLCQEVIDYCLHDCEITAHLLELGLKGKLIDPNTGNKLQLRQLW
jgi:DEAD/DEAH box helicase domain-containing protein